MGTMIEFDRADGAKAHGYLASATRPGAPGVVVIQEWWGVQDQITGICDRLAAAGYHALAPDLYGGKVVPYHDVESANREMSSLDFQEATDQAVRGAVQHFTLRGVRAGLTGFCMGGVVTVLGAIRVPELDAAVCFYGLPSEDQADVSQIRVPFQGHFANRDDWCTPRAVDAFVAKLEAAGKSPEIFRYDADHGFVNEQREVHDAAAAHQAWERMLAFWKQHLG